MKRFLKLMKKKDIQSFDVKTLDDNRLIVLNFNISDESLKSLKLFTRTSKVICGFLYNDKRCLFFGTLDNLYSFSQKELNVSKENEKFFVGFKNSDWRNSFLIKSKKNVDFFGDGIDLNKCILECELDLLNQKEHPNNTFKITFFNDFADFLCLRKLFVLFALKEIGNKHGFKIPKCLVIHLFKNYIKY